MKEDQIIEDMVEEEEIEVDEINKRGRLKEKAEELKKELNEAMDTIIKNIEYGLAACLDDIEMDVDSLSQWIQLLKITCRTPGRRKKCFIES